MREPTPAMFQRLLNERKQEREAFEAMREALKGIVKWVDADCDPSATSINRARAALRLAEAWQDAVNIVQRHGAAVVRGAAAQGDGVQGGDAGRVRERYAGHEAGDVFLGRDEYELIVSRVGREPSAVELGMFGALWSDLDPRRRSNS